MRMMLGALLLFLAVGSQASSEVDELVARAVKELNATDYRAGNSTAQRLLHEAISLDPEHIEANWQILFLAMKQTRNYDLSHKAPMLLPINELFREFEKLLSNNQQPAFLHYARSHFAFTYSAYEEAMAEIDKALELEPKSSRFLYWKAEAFMQRGIFEHNDDYIREAEKVYQEALKYYPENPDSMIEESDIYNSMALGESRLSQPDYEKIIEYYTKGIELTSEPRESLYAWARMSEAYRHLGHCQDALQAAQRALDIEDYYEASRNKRFAEFCLESEQLLKELDSG